jgi:quinol monooxygenase YgiN
MNLVQDMVKMVEANEPDTVNYEFYLNTAEKICVVNEVYKNSDAALAHAKGACITNNTPKDFQYL